MKLLALLAGIASPLAAAPIVISNADFEDGLTGWVVPSKYAARIASTSDTPHAGEKAVQIDVAADAEEPYLFAEISPIQGSATYRWSAFARRAVGGDGGKAGVKIEFYNARGENTSGVWFRKPLESAGSWMPLAVTAQADPDSVRAMLLLGASGVGAVAFDTAALEQTSLAPTLRILDPLRLAVRSNTAPPAKFTVAFQEKPAPAPPFAMEVLGGPRRLKQDARSQTLDAKTFSLTTRIPSLAAGIYTADVLSGALRSGTPAQLFATPLLRKPARLDTAGAALRRGKSFFPIGLYHVNHNSGEYANLAANGFNAIQGSFTTDITQLRTLLDLAQANGLAVAVPLHAGNLVAQNLDSALARIRALDTHPAVLSWKIFDEPDADQNAGVRDEVLQAYLALKKIRPLQPLELTLADDATLGFWTRACDLVEIDRYPVPGHPLTGVLDSCTAAVKAKEAWQNLTCVIQCGWTPDLKTQPTFAQARSMVYLALIGGAKGIFWYSRQDPGWNLTTTPLWPRLKEINAEIAALARPVLQGRTVLGMKCNVTTIPFFTRQYGRTVYLLATNPGDTAQDVVFTFPASVRPHLARLLDGSQGVTLKQQTATLHLAATGSATIVLEL